jgi:hypothetical protein
MVKNSARQKEVVLGYVSTFYPLVNIPKTDGKITIYSGFSHETW